MSVTAQNRLLAAFVAALIATALILTWGNRGPLIDTTERPMPIVPEWTPATCCEAVEYQEGR